MTIDRKIGLEIRNGHEVGRDPREMTADELNALGHQPMSLQKALRLRCVDCSAGSELEVRRCKLVQCAAWPFRMGENPWRKPASEKLKEHGRRLGLKALNAGRERLIDKEQNEKPKVAATTLPADIADRRDLEKSSSKPEGSRKSGEPTPQHAERVDGGAR